MSTISTATGSCAPEGSTIASPQPVLLASELSFEFSLTRERHALTVRKENPARHRGTPGLCPSATPDYAGSAPEAKRRASSARERIWSFA